MKRVRRIKNEILSETQNPNQLPPGDNSVVDDNKNPMLNSVILGHFFEVIPFNFQDFKNFRQVSKLWLESSLGRWRQEAWIHLRDANRRQDVTPFFYKPYVEMLSLPGDPHQLLGKYAFQKYKLSGAKNCLKFFGEDALLPFWSKVGPSITHLKVIRTSLGPCEQFMKILREMIPKMQFLALERCNFLNAWSAQPYTYLTPYPYTPYEMREVNIPPWNNRLFPEAHEVRTNLTHFEVTFESDRRNFGVSWAYFFLRFPNIQILKLQDVPAPTPSSWNPRDELLRIFESLQMVRANGGGDTLSRLEHLDLLNLQQEAVQLFRPDFVNLLSSLAFPLLSLSIDVGFQQDEAGLKRILEPYSITLKKLLVYRGPYAEPFTQNFPYGVALPNLEELRLIGPICGNLDFLENTPSLKTLVLLDGQTPMEQKVLHSYVEFSLDRLSKKEYGGWRRPRVLYNKVDIISSTNFASEPLKNLVLPQMEEFIVGHELCDVADIEALGKLMPALKRLRMGLDNEGFKVACKNWAQLRHLDLDPFDVEEEGFLGIKDGKKYSQPNITDLKYLTSLRIGDHSSNDSTKGRLTQGSVVDGLLVSESLRSVWIRRAPFVRRANAEVLRMFASRFPQ